MTHDELRDRLLDLACGELSPREARTVEEHAASCEGCRAELARMRETRRLMSALPQEPAPPEGESILLSAAREAVRRREPRWALPRWVWGGSVAAMSLAAVVAVSYRVLSVRPAPPGREDPNALLGESPYASAPAEGPERAQAEAGAARADAGAPPRAERESRLADAAPSGRSAPGDRPAQKKARALSREPARAADANGAPPEQRMGRMERPEREDLAAREAPAAVPPPAAASRAAQPSPAAPESAAPAGAVAGIVPDRSAETPRAESLRSAAPPRATPAPARRAAQAAAPAQRKADVGSGPAADDPAAAALARYEELGRTGRLRAEVRSFPGCAGELARRLERDPEGRVVSYAWEAMLGDRRVRYEVVYAADGSVVRASAVDAATGEIERATVRPPPLRAIDLDAPPRCGR